MIRWFTTLVTFLVLDGLWLGVITRSWYKKQIGHLFAEHVQWWAVGLFYVLYVSALQWLVIQPALQERLSIGQLALRAAIFGGIAYATYDLTNQATLRGWPVSVTLIDVLWGAVVTTLATLVGYWVYRRFVV